MANQALADARPPGVGAQGAARSNTLSDWGQLFRARLRDRRFWLIQAMVVGVSGAHAATEYYAILEAEHVAEVYFVPASLYFFPVLYASLNFGREGAVPTAVWSAALAIPNIILWHHGLERFGEAFQMTIMILLASVVAWRVDKEVVARQRAETMEGARARSEVKYRALFDGAAEPILVLDGAGVIQEANAAAGELLGSATSRLNGGTISEVFGPQSAGILAQAVMSPDVRTELRLSRPDGSDVWLEPLCTVVPDASGKALAQVLLKDVTERRGFQHYAREITRAQEAERQRIAQELHDVSVQSAIMICRRLDAAAEAVEEGSLEGIMRTIVEARLTAETMADELRRFSRDLRPLILDDLGLVPALKRLLLELRERSSIDTRFNVSGPGRRLDSSIELAMFRIGQEALRNVESHAEASHASLDIEFDSTNVTLTVYDNGSGFEVPNLAALTSGGRLGLLGMKERAQLVGGVCEIHSTPGAGTSVKAVVPALGAAQPLGTG